MGRLFIFIMSGNVTRAFTLMVLQFFIITEYQLLYEGGVGVAMKKLKLLLALCQKRLCITYDIDFMRKAFYNQLSDKNL